MRRAAGGRGEKVVIVGAGVAGLCAGVYARKVGLEAEIVEMGQSSGGLATSWRRGDYTFETCLEWLLGSKQGSSWHALWKEVFDIDALKFVDPAEYGRLETEEGQSLVVPVSPDLLERELLRVAPEDARAIKRLAQGVRRLQRFDLPVHEEAAWRNVAGWARAAPVLPELWYWSRLTVKQVAERFQNPLLRAFFGLGLQSRISAVALVLSLAWMARGDAGYPVGGSEAVIKRIEARFRELGGTIRFGARVDRILIERRQAVGVHLSDGQEVRADWVVSAADGHSTLFDWIPEEFRDRRTTELYHSAPVFPSYVQVSFGIRRDLRDLPRSFIRTLKKPLQIDPETETRQLRYRVFNFDPSFAPSGETAVTCDLWTYNHAYWRELQATNADEYATRKRAIADFVAEVLERRVPGVCADIAEVDVSTPATVVRYTGNWKGSIEGFLPTPETGFQRPRLKLPGLDRFLMAGQWVVPGGGLPTGLMTGRRCIQEICKATHRRFTPQQAPARIKTVPRPAPA